MTAAGTTTSQRISIRFGESPCCFMAADKKCRRGVDTLLKALQCAVLTLPDCLLPTETRRRRAAIFLYDWRAASSIPPYFRGTISRWPFMGTGKSSRKGWPPEKVWEEAKKQRNYRCLGRPTISFSHEMTLKWDWKEVDAKLGFQFSVPSNQIPASTCGFRLHGCYGSVSLCRKARAWAVNKC